MIEMKMFDIDYVTVERDDDGYATIKFHVSHSEGWEEVYIELSKSRATELRQELQLYEQETDLEEV